MGEPHRQCQWTWTSDETRESEERLVSQIASHVAKLGDTAVVRVVASASFLKTLTDRLPLGTDVKADFAAPLSAGFDARVTVVTPASTATFELKRVGKVTPHVIETVTIGTQVWAKTNLSDVTGLSRAENAVNFTRYGYAGTPAYIIAPSGDTFYNAYAVLKLVPPADFRLPTEDELEILLTSYQSRFTSTGDITEAMGNELGVKFGGWITNNQLNGAGDMDEWWADKCTATLRISKTSASDVKTIPNVLWPFTGCSVRLIRNQA